MELPQAALIVSKNYIFERIVTTTVSTLSEPFVKQIVENYLRWHPTVRDRIRQGTLTLSELLGIISSLDEATRINIDRWVQEKAGKTVADLVTDAQMFEQKMPEGAEAVRTIVLHEINKIYKTVLA